MNFFSEERASELKDLFFESATELLQALNEEGLELEKRPGDAEIVRQVRRTVHTLKGDSAACGYRELSELAHELEDILTPELAQRYNGEVAELVLHAADTFQGMLSAYRSNSPVPPSDHLMETIHAMVRPVAATGDDTHIPHGAQERFAWTEYQQLVIADAARRGLRILQISLKVDPFCMVKAAAVQLAKTALQELGNLLVLSPDESAPTAHIEFVEAALATSFDAALVSQKCRIPTVISEVVIERFGEEPAPHPEVDQDLLGLLASAEAEESALDKQLAVAKAQDAGIAEALEQFGHDDFDFHPSESLLLSSEPVPMSAPQHSSGSAAAIEAAAQSSTLANATAESTLRVDAERIDTVLDLVGELIIGKSMLTQTMHEFDRRFTKDPIRAKLQDALAFQARVLNDLQKSVMKIRMVPVEQLFRRFPRLVRDVSKSVNKEVVLQLKGQDTDLDKSILDVLAEPMAHLVRNAVDHGVESPAEREAAGKPREGVIRLNAYHQGNQIVIEVSDDGKGIDKDRVVNKAIERGLVTPEDAARLSENDALSLIFHPGLSTAEQVTSISGRGVGMDVVNTVLERLKGSVSIESRPGIGTTFLLKVPLTLAIIKALLFRVSTKLYAVPLGSVLEIARANETDIHRVDQHEVLRLRDQVLTLVRLNKLSKRRDAASAKIFIVVVSLGDRRFGLIVDRLVGEEELVIKALDDHLVATDLVSGASILGDGTVVLILNISSVVARLGKSEALSAGATA